MYIGYMVFVEFHLDPYFNTYPKLKMAINDIMHIQIQYDTRPLQVLHNNESDNHSIEHHSDPDEFCYINSFQEWFFGQA